MLHANLPRRSLPMALRTALSILLVALGGVAACGGGSPDCKNACDKVSSCGLKSSGLSCDSSCAQSDCAACVDAPSCADLDAGKCASRCPGVSFSKK
jgi:hypothetical protein